MRDWDPKRNHNNDRRPIRIIRMPLLPLFECQPFYYQNHVPMSVFFCATSARYGMEGSSCNETHYYG
jgi:hypothetical protein